MTPIEKIESLRSTMELKTREMQRLERLQARIEVSYSLLPGDLRVQTHARNISEPRKLFTYIACKRWGVTTDTAAYYIGCKRSNVSIQAKSWQDMCDHYPTYAAITNMIIDTLT